MFVVRTLNTALVLLLLPLLLVFLELVFILISFILTAVRILVCFSVSLMLNAMDPKIKLLLTPGVQELIQDLDLEIGRHPGACPRTHNLVPFDLTPAQRHQQLCKDLYLRNRKFSRYVYPSYTNIAHKRVGPEQELSGTLW